MAMSPEVTEDVIARQPPEAQAIIRALLARIAEMEAELGELRGQVKGKTPQNSSLPPSTQHPHAKPKSRKRKSKRKRGGQSGHPKHERPLIPTDQCDDVQPLRPTECRRCGEKLSGKDEFYTYLCPCQLASAGFLGPVGRRLSRETGRCSLSHNSIAA
jgi:transposase